MTTVSVVDQLKVLIELQGIDGQVYQKRRQLESKPAEVSSLKAAHQKNLQGIQTAETQYKTLEVKRREKEMELEQKEGQIKKLQGQTFQVKTNKEYTAMQKEIEGLKADKSVLEEEVLKIMEEADQFKGRLQTEKEALKAKEAEFAKTLARIEEETKAIQSVLAQLQATRSNLIPKVESQILSRYERILERKEGLALVPVRNGACGGCNMVLPHQAINEIMGASRLITCESCTRILYIEPTN